jgi:hypothetical protein
MNTERRETMTTNEFEDNGAFVTEKHYSVDEFRQVYGTTDLRELNQRFAENAARATDGNCSHWAIYTPDGITEVVEC